MYERNNKFQQKTDLIHIGVWLFITLTTAMILSVSCRAPNLFNKFNNTKRLRVRTHFSAAVQSKCS